jgi:hypothetical protein
MQVTLTIRTTSGPSRPDQQVDLEIADAVDFQTQVHRYTASLRAASDLEVGVATAPEHEAALLAMLATIYPCEA